MNMTKSEAAKARWANEEYRKKTLEAIKGKKRIRGPLSEDMRKKAQANSPFKKTVYQFSLGGKQVAEFLSINDVARKTGYDVGKISKCCNGKCRTAYGYTWSFTNNKMEA